MSVSSFEQDKTTVLPLLKKREYEQALRILEKSTTSSRKEALDLLEMRAMCYFRLEKYPEAIACYQQLSEENPQSAKPLINLGAVYNRTQQYDRAITELRKAIGRDKANVDAYYNLGFAQRHAGHVDLAISAYKEALRINPHLEQGHLNLANAYLELGNTALATTHYRATLAINESSEPAKRGLQRTYDREMEKQQGNNPFGRLVDVTTLSHQKSAAAIRTLSESERRQDRQQVQKLVKGSRNAARHVSEELREKMQPALLALTRALIDGEQHPDHIEQTHQRFHEELFRFHEGFRYLKRSVLELRGHEEEMNTPDFDI